MDKEKVINNVEESEGELLVKKVIMRTVYDTRNSEFVARANSEYDVIDPRCCKEELYKAPNGAWFVAGVGGPSSKYKENGEGLELLSPDQARFWMEENRVDEKIILKYFKKKEWSWVLYL